MRLKARDRPADLVAGGRLRHPHRQVAAAHPLGGGDQPADRPGDLVGDHQPDQRRGAQHQQRDQREDQREGRPAARSGSGPAAGIRPPPARCAVMWSSMAGSTGRPISSISGGVDVQLHHRAHPGGSSLPSTATSPAARRARSPSAGGGSVRPARPRPCTCAGHRSKITASVSAAQRGLRAQHLGEGVRDRRPRKLVARVRSLAMPSASARMLLRCSSR